jgi:hypothetical protein
LEPGAAPSGSIGQSRIEQSRIEMRFFAALAAICALCQPAMAQAPDCKSMTKADARLACYDKATPPAAAAKPASRPGPGPKADTAKYVDTISAEDAVMNARLKSICRGC